MGAAILSVLKLLFAISILPVCYALTVSFVGAMPHMAGLESLFVWGGGAYVLLHLFFYSPQGIFQFGQKVFGDIFKSIPVLAAVVPLLFPFIPVVLLVVCFLTKAYFEYAPAVPYLIFFSGFSLAMHLIVSAHAEFEEDTNGLKPHYLFLMSLAFISNLLIVGALLNLIFPAFSIVEICKSAFEIARDIYLDVYTQLFLPPVSGS